MKHIFYFFICLISCQVLDAQVSIGAKGGISIPQLKGNNDNSRGYTSRLDVYGGLLVNIPIGSGLSLQPEVVYSPQGGQRKGMQEVSSDALSGLSLPPGMSIYANFKAVTMLNYLEIPVLLKLTGGERLKYFACLGPHIAFLLEARTRTSGSSLLYADAGGTTPLSENGSALPPMDFSGTTSIRESIKEVNAGLQGGLGLQYPFGNGSVFLEGRAIIGLTNIQTHPEVDGHNKTGSLAVALGYLLKIHK
jgi:hypothetical protein